MKRTKIQDISKNPDKPLAEASEFDLMPLPGISTDNKAAVTPLTDEQRAECECSLDGVSALNLPKPKNKEEEDKLVASFLSGLEKLLSKENNWTFLQPLKLSLKLARYMSAADGRIFTVRPIVRKYCGVSSKNTCTAVAY
jgi:hypothetical protein